MSEYEMIQALSGIDESTGEPKAGIALYHEILGSDGSVRQIEEVFIKKPEIRIYKDFNNMVRIDCVYDYPDDQDLLRQYMVLENYFMPENSAKFNEKDLYETKVTNHEFFSFDVLEEINGEDDVVVELLDGRVISGLAYTESDASLSKFYLEFFENEEGETEGEVIDIEEVVSIKLDEKEIYSNRDSEQEKIILYSHVLTVNIISLNPQGKVAMTAKDNPLFYSLVPARPNEPATILRMIYQKNDVLIEEYTEEKVKEMEDSGLEEIRFEEAYQ